MVLGLTGKYCSGKNVVATSLSNRGWYVVEEDQIGHLALMAKQDEIVEAFGRPIVGDDGTVSRPALGRIVFGDQRSLRRLESIVHPWMVGETERRLADHSGNAVVNAAILFKMGLETMCDRVVVVRSWIYLRFMRARRRDGIRIGEIMKRQWTQRSLNRAPFGVDTITVRNNRSRKHLERRIDRLLESGLEG